MCLYNPEMQGLRKCCLLGSLWPDLGSSSLLHPVDCMSHRGNLVEGRPVYWGSAQHRLTAASQGPPGPPGPKQPQLDKPQPAAARIPLDVDSRQRCPHPLRSHTEIFSGSAASASSNNSFKGSDAEMLCERAPAEPFHVFCLHSQGQSCQMTQRAGKVTAEAPTSGDR